MNFWKKSLGALEHAVVRELGIALDEAVGDLEAAGSRGGEDPAVFLGVAFARGVPHRAEVEPAAVLVLDDVGERALAHYSMFAGSCQWSPETA